MKYLVIIPARGGSVGVPGKNIRLLAGKPLIVWSIEQALSCKKIDRIIVSTDDEKIAKISKDYHGEVPFIRPADLSTNQATTESAMIHTLKWLAENENYHPDAVILLQCTSPLRLKGTIDQAIAQFEREKADSLLSVCEFNHFLWSQYPDVHAFYDYSNRPRRQDIKSSDKRFKENGSIYISSTSGLLDHNNRLFGQISLFVMQEYLSLEIDTQFDFDLIESIIHSRGFT